MVNDSSPDTGSVLPLELLEWLGSQGWEKKASLEDIAQWWRHDRYEVIVPTRKDSPDFSLRWEQALEALAKAFKTDPAGVLLAVSNSGSDVAEFKASGQIDDTLPLGDATVFIDSVRRAILASASSAVQPRGYYGRRITKTARDHAQNVRMGQTRAGSYIVPVISRIPTQEPENENDEDAILFDDAVYQPFARKAMLKLADALSALRGLTHSASIPKMREIAEAVEHGVSYELCDAVANVLEQQSISDLDVAFTMAERLPLSRRVNPVRLERESAHLLRQVGSALEGRPIVARQSVTGYVRRLDRGEEDEVGRVTLRIIDQDKARNVTLELDETNYQAAGAANTDRRMVRVTGILHREPGRSLRFSEVETFALEPELPLFPDDPMG